jgi:hypothetical protein
MIIYGWRTKTSKLKPLGVGNCKECGKGPIRSFTVFRYFHIYWVPLFPYSRTLWLNCEHCQATYEPNQAGTENFIPTNELQKERPPLYMFAGLAVIACIAAIAAWANHQDHQKYQALLKQPQVGDLIVMKLPQSKDPSYQFGVAKVVSMDDKEVHLAPSTYLFSDASTARSGKSLKLLRTADAFADQELVYKRESLLQLFEAGTITAAIRQNGGAAVDPPKIPGVQVNVR